MLNLFERKFLVDERNPVGTIETGGLKLSFFAPDPMYILQLLSILGITALVGNFLSLIVCHGILRKSQQTAFVLTFGIVLPLILYYPFFLADVLDIRSSPIRMTVLSLPLTCTLRTLHAFFTEQQSTLWSRYRREYGFILHPLRDPKTQAFVTATVHSFFAALRSYGKWFFLLGISFSLLLPYSFVPWNTPRPLHETFLSFHPSHLANNFVHAVLTSWMLDLGVNTAVNGVMQCLSGIQFENVVDSPMFGSQSPSDFWGRRWNRLISGDLKNGIYKPVRQYTGSKHVATLATFAVSGLMHEYVWYYLFYVNKHQDPADCYQPPFGKQILFFGWNGILLLFEYFVGKQKWERVVKGLFPACTTVLVVLMALPVGHLFTGDLVAGGYFQQLSGLLAIVHIDYKS
ncbi:hypothetical protein FisN_8Lh220 [Fistulifera solaris]|uniref:Wax synthase domain-containing protein n=1 Tax=Fistulifera solaris TaxID=1519565 RepID=A0A1Z5JNC8_FISSO|nr:hypothetical protein FisN_8Lh220 [Fistulifera solaris]|eukprot:GAX15479.1 hypothetical protein FisN_8Lh220 [Fistulifera solaris]